MNAFIFVAMAICLANASLMERRAGVGGLYGYESSMQYPGMMQNQGMMEDKEMPLMGMMGPRNVMSGAQGYGGMGLSGGMSSGLCNSVCRTQMMNQDSNQMAYDQIETAQQMQMMQIMNDVKETVNKQTGPEMSSMPQISDKAMKLAQQIMRQTQLAEQAQMQQMLQDMQRQPKKSLLNGLGFATVQKMAQQRAVNQLSQTMMLNQGNMMMNPQNNMTKLMERTLEVAIMGQMAMKNMQNQQKTQMPMMFDTQMMGNFAIQIQQLFEQNNMLRTATALAKYEIQAKQIQVQLQFLNQRLQQVQLSQLLMAQQQGPVSPQVSQSMQQVQKEMYQQQAQLMTEQVAQQMIINRLQQVLLSQQNMMQELIAEQGTYQMSNPSMYMSSMGMMPMMMKA